MLEAWENEANESKKILFTLSTRHWYLSKGNGRNSGRSFRERTESLRFHRDLVTGPEISGRNLPGGVKFLENQLV